MIQLNLSSEDKLLLYCSRVEMDEKIKHKVNEILDEVLNWNYIVECSVRQGISPLFYWNLKKVNNGKDVPSEVVKSLEKMYYDNLARNMLLYNELNKILKALKNACIDVIVLKGAFLAEEIYKNIGLRPMSDIDLLIKKKDLEKAEKELAKLTYFATTMIFPTKLHEKYQIELANELLPFVHETKKIVIDIHWDILPLQISYNVDINKFWENAKSVKIAGTEAMTFAPEDILQHLCLHLDKHFNYIVAPPAKPLRDYCDIAEITKHYKETIDWKYFLKKSKSYRIEKPIFQGLYIANKYFGALIPENVLSELEHTEPRTNFEEIFKGTNEDGSSIKNQSHAINYLITLKLVNGTYNKVRIVLGDIFPSKEFMMHRYSIKNEKQVYMYHLIRSGTALRWGLDVLWRLPHYFMRSAFSK
jgi:hypothetical protein